MWTATSDSRVGVEGGHPAVVLGIGAGIERDGERGDRVGPAAELPADGDPLDVLVLGRGIERAAVARTRIIGVLEMQHDGVRDDKLIAVPLDEELVNGFSRLRELEQLDAHYPESRAILVLWFSNYWGAGNTEVVGWGNAAEANAILDAALIEAATDRVVLTTRHD